MSIIQTHKWLERYIANKDQSFQKNLHVQKEAIGEQLTTYFDHATAYDIHVHLLNHGLFVPDPLDKQVIQEMIAFDYWSKTKKIIAQLRKKWEGPDIPIFIFPSDYTNELLQSEFNGRSGLSYHDKIFLFITNKTSIKEMAALITHEFNHVCRLSTRRKDERDLDLLDAIILEGLAEHAVKTEVGSAFLANWTERYTMQSAQENWEKWIKPNITTKKSNALHDQLMYGNKKIPKWLGYNIGYHLVSTYITNTKATMYDLLKTSSQTILESSDFN